MIKPQKIETVREGATYMVPTYWVVSDVGLQFFGEKLISFVKGAKDNSDIPRQPGYMTETLLKVCQTYLEDVSKNHLKDDDTQLAILHIKNAIEALERRVEKRKARGVYGTYKP